MMRRLSSFALSFTLALTFAAPPLSAGEPVSDSEANKAQAAQRFDRGLQLFNEGDNAGALAEFKQTYALVPNPIVLFNIGLVYAAMGRPVDAVDALSAIVDGATLSVEQRERAQKTLAEQRDRIGRVSVTTEPPGARIDIDGVEVAKTPLSGPLRVAVGSHVIGAVAEGYAPAHKEVIVAGNADASVRFELVLGSAKRPANLTIRSRVLDADITLDGQAVGKTPLSTSLAVPAGLHQVELRRSGYKPAQQQVELGEGATGEVTIDPPLDAHALAAEGSDFWLDLREPNGNLTLDDEHLGLYSHGLRLAKGRHRVRIEVAGYLPFEQDVTLEAGKPYVLTPFLVPTPETRQAHDSNVRLHRTLGWIGVGIGAAVAGTGVALVAVGGSHKSSAQRDFDAADAIIAAGQNGMGDAGPCKLGTVDYMVEACVAPRDAAETRIERANTEKTLGFVGIGVGAALAATGVVLLITGESSHRFDPPKSKDASARGSGLALVPGPGQFGLGLLGAF